MGQTELVKRGCINRATSKEDRVANLLSFFGVASVAAWRGNSVRVAYRHSRQLNLAPAGGISRGATAPTASRLWLVLEL